jgi:hypothetical protein
MKWDCDDLEVKRVQYFENFPITFKKKFPKNHCPSGYLTKLGVEQHIQLGKYFYEKYKDFDLIKNINDIRIESTNYPRTLSSAKSFIYGYFKYNLNLIKRKTIIIKTFDRDFTDLYFKINYLGMRILKFVQNLK